MGTQNEAFITDILFQPIKLGKTELANRMAMAPLTRSRANDALEPTDMVVEYYRQRASVGLIIAEATQISETAQGYTNTPGIHTPGQIAAWKQVTDAVHAKGGKIFVQLWHTGRMSHNAFQPNQQAPVALGHRPQGKDLHRRPGLRGLRRAARAGNGRDCGRSERLPPGRRQRHCSRF